MLRILVLALALCACGPAKPPPAVDMSEAHPEDRSVEETLGGAPPQATAQNEQADPKEPAAEAPKVEPFRITSGDWLAQLAQGASPEGPGLAEIGHVSIHFNRDNAPVITRSARGWRSSAALPAPGSTLSFEWGEAPTPPPPLPPPAPVPPPPEGAPTWLNGAGAGVVYKATPAAGALRAIVSKMKPGDILELAPGDYGPQVFAQNFAAPGIIIRSETLFGARMGINGQVTITGAGYWFQQVDFVHTATPNIVNLVSVYGMAQRIAFSRCWLGPGRGSNSDTIKLAGGDVTDVYVRHCVLTSGTDDIVDFNSAQRVDFIENIITPTDGIKGHSGVQTKNSVTKYGKPLARNKDYRFLRNVFMGWNNALSQPWLDMGNSHGPGEGAPANSAPAVEDALIENNLFVAGGGAGPFHLGWVTGVTVRNNTVIALGGSRALAGFFGAPGTTVLDARFASNLFVGRAAATQFAYLYAGTSPAQPKGMATNQAWPKGTLPAGWAEPQWADPAYAPIGDSHWVTRTRVAQAGGIDALRRALARQWAPSAATRDRLRPSADMPQLNILGEAHSGKVGCF